MIELLTGTASMSRINDFYGHMELGNAIKKSHGDGPFDISASIR
jgi:hypothetical protein